MGQQTPSVKGQRVNMLGFEGHVVCVCQLSCCAKQPRVTRKQTRVSAFQYNFIYKNAYWAAFNLEKNLQILALAVNTPQNKSATYCDKVFVWSNKKGTSVKRTNNDNKGVQDMLPHIWLLGVLTISS